MSERRLDPPIRTRRIYEGRIVNLRESEYRRPSGVVVQREVMDHNGAVVMVPVDDTHVFMIRQPREAVEQYLLELPAGKLDFRGEDPLEAAKRELAEEIGREAGTWRDLGGFFTAPALITEYIHCFMATDLREVDHPGIEEEEIEVVPWPLGDLDALLAQVEDAKTLVGLLRLARERGL